MTPACHSRYLLARRDALHQETRKYFNHVAVDEDFRATVGIGGAGCHPALVGTVRAPTCRYVAGDQSDVCDQCKLLQVPIEFLGL